MSVQELKDRLYDVPGIQTLTMQYLTGRNCYGFDGHLIAVDPNTPIDEIENEIRKAARLPAVPFGAPKNRPMTAQTSFAASIKAMIDKARADVENARQEGMQKVSASISKLTEAQAAIVNVSHSMAKTVEDEAAAVLAELGQISNDLTGESSNG